VAVGVVADAVELQVRVAHARFESRLAEFLALGELDAVGRGLHAVVADLARMANCVKESRMHGWLAAGKLHGHLPARLDLGGVLEDFLNLFPAEFVDVADLVRVHEAGIAHHVAAVGEVHGKNGTAAVANRAGAVTMQLFVVVRRNITAGEILFDPFQELGVNRHQVFVFSVNGAFLYHPDLAIALDNLRFDFADFFMDQIGPVFFSVDDQIARFTHAIGTQGIRGARPTEGRLGFLPGLQQRLIRPLRRKRRIGIKFIEVLNRVVSDACSLAKRPIESFPKLRV
jgi:hypothetical protein